MSCENSQRTSNKVMQDSAMYTLEQSELHCSDQNTTSSSHCHQSNNQQIKVLVLYIFYCINRLTTTKVFST